MPHQDRKTKLLAPFSPSYLPCSLREFAESREGIPRKGEHQGKDLLLLDIIVHASSLTELAGFFEVEEVEEEEGEVGR